MIAFSDIYDRFINIVDDPQINKAYVANTIKFQKLCYKFLTNGLSYFTAPVKAAAMTSNQKAPDGETEAILGDGGKTYTITMTIPEGAQVVCSIGQTPDLEAEINGQTVTFSENVKNGKYAFVEWYVGGEFTADFTLAAGGMDKSYFVQRVVEILAKAMVVAWADKEQNFLLDIRNLLNDTDFKLHSPANSLKSKKDWVESLRYDIYSTQNKLDWDLRNQTRSYYGY